MKERQSAFKRFFVNFLFYVLKLNRTKRIIQLKLRQELGYIDESAYIGIPDECTCPQKVFLYEGVNIYGHSLIIISPNGASGKFIMKRNSGSAEGLTVITGSHGRKVGHFFKEFSTQHVLDVDKDIIVEEDVWLGANVTLLPGVIIGRGATVGAGAVCLKSIPPYAIVVGNPAKIVGFCFTPEEIVDHEKAIYREEERIPLQQLEKNYQKYYLSRLKEIKEFTKL